jgi:hypothetical protein
MGAAPGRVWCEMIEMCRGGRHAPCPPQVLVAKEKDPATGEMPVADTRERPPRLGLHITSRTCGYRMLEPGGMYT